MSRASGGKTKNRLRMRVGLGLRPYLVLSERVKGFEPSVFSLARRSRQTDQERTVITIDDPLPKPAQHGENQRETRIFEAHRNDASSLKFHRQYSTQYRLNQIEQVIECMLLRPRSRAGFPYGFLRFSRR